MFTINNYNTMDQDKVINELNSLKIVLCDCCTDTVKIEETHEVVIVSTNEKCRLCFKCFDQIIWTKEA